MSLATSALIHPSRMLRLMKLAMVIVLLLSAVKLMTVSGMHGPDLAHILGGGVCVFAGCLLLLSCRTSEKILRIDITATGKIRLTHTGDDAFVQRQGHSTRLTDEGEVVQLLKDSTLWPSMLILRLRDESGKVIVLPILRDSMSQHAFHAVCVACRWVAAQNTRAASASPRSESRFD